MMDHKELAKQILDDIPQGLDADAFIVMIVAEAVRRTETPLLQQIELLKREVAYAENGYNHWRPDRRPETND